MKFVQRAGVVAGAVAWMLAGCGGGTEESAGTSAARETAAALQVVTKSLTITGTAATGDALAGATVTAKCAGNGGGTAVVNDKGRFSLQATGKLPCVLEVPVPTMDLKLHGALVKGRAANLTPLTELALARVAGGSAAALFDSFDAAAQGKLTEASLAAALKALRSALQDQVALGTGDPFTVSFAVHDAHDRKLDAVMDTLTRARATLPDVGRALAASGATPESVRTLLQPAAASCRGLRTGRYRVLSPLSADDGGALVQVDAQALRVTVPGSTAPVQLQDQGNCSFVFSPLPGATGRLVVTASGVGVLTLPTAMGATASFNAAALVLPEQNLPLAELAGEWNMLDYARHEGSGLLSADYRSFSATAKGAVQVTQVCSALECSKPVNPLALQMRPNAAGGFTFDYSGGKARAFAFKAADGHVSLAIWLPGSSGGVAFAARQAALSLPVVGTVNRFWDLSVNSAGAVSSPVSAEVTITAADAAAGTSTRTRTSDGRVDTLVYNQPLPGLRYRNTGACSINGVPKSCDGTVMLPLPGTGVTVYAGLAPATFLGVSISQP